REFLPSGCRATTREGAPRHRSVAGRPASHLVVRRLGALAVTAVTGQAFSLLSRGTDGKSPTVAEASDAEMDVSLRARQLAAPPCSIHCLTGAAAAGPTEPGVCSGIPAPYRRSASVFSTSLM